MLEEEIFDDITNISDPIEEPIEIIDENSNISADDETSNEIIEEEPEEGFEMQESELIPNDFNDVLNIEGTPAINELQQSDQNDEETPVSNEKEEEQEIYQIEEITQAVKIIEANQKTGIENLQLISTCSLGINTMIFGGFVIYCFLNRLG